MDCSFSAPPPTKDYINKRWCGVDVEHEPGPPRMSPPVERHHSSSDLRGQLRYINTEERRGEGTFPQELGTVVLGVFQPQGPGSK
ncbi:hypothetical protein DPX16_6678 [Anabarilius grahami]|uniref:Uncharacterized protein n=1 Tax=Anabarilius grahami TaxID=495550 RepID=A0A3N0YPS7_ANAGA|nr:hypothetical protein DPX16_6678 [Anabarilius grahami]